MRFLILNKVLARDLIEILILEQSRFSMRKKLIFFVRAGGCSLISFSSWVRAEPQRLRRSRQRFLCILD